LKSALIIPPFLTTLPHGGKAASLTFDGGYFFGFLLYIDHENHKNDALAYTILLG
jgi:hypothetical protein